MSVLDRIVPGYYHRLNADGVVETSTCCPNTASEHAMMEKLLIDSVLLWARHYRVDGFRFDLMGHHMKRNMLTTARGARRADARARDGVDGRRISSTARAGTSARWRSNARGVNAVQRNMAGTGIGTFNDRLRDAARGGGPFTGLQEQGFVTGLWTDPNGIDQGSADDAARSPARLPGPHQGRPGRQPPRRRHHRSPWRVGARRCSSTTTARQPATPPTRRRRQLRRGARQRDAVGRHPAQGRAGHRRGRARRACRCWA